MLSLKLNNQKVPHKPCHSDFQTQVGIRNCFRLLPEEITYTQSSSSKISVEETNADGYMQNIHALHGGVPARCTPVAQQYDAGIIAMVKGKLLCDQLQCCVLTYVMAGQMRGRRKMTCNLYATDMH